MKTTISTFVESRVLKGATLLALIAGVAASMAWSVSDDGRIKLGGTWVGRSGDITWTGTYTPDPSGQNAVETLQWMTLSVEFEALMGSLGADRMSIVSGYLSMTGRNTASGKLIWYALSPGTASPTTPAAGQVKAIAVMSSDWTFASATTAEGTHNLKMYLPNAQGSLLPEDGTLFMDVTFDKVAHQRIF